MAFPNTVKQNEDTLIEVIVVEAGVQVDFSTAVDVKAFLKDSDGVIMDSFALTPAGEESLLTLPSSTAIQLHAVDVNTLNYPVGKLYCTIEAYFPTVPPTGVFPDDNQKQTYKVDIGKVIAAD